MALTEALVHLQRLLDISEPGRSSLDRQDDVDSPTFLISPGSGVGVWADELSALQQIEEISQRIENIKTAVANTITPVLETLSSRRSEVQKRVNAARSLRAPVQKLPTEVLSNIFVRTSNDFRWDCRCLLLVSRRWNRVARSTPRMWSLLILHLDRARFHEFVTMRLPLIESGPLEVRCVEDEDNPGQFIHNGPFWTPVELMISPLRTECHRIVKLHLLIHNISSDRQPLHLSLPVLRTLYIGQACAGSADACYDCFELLGHFTIHAPQLRELTVEKPYQINVVRGCLAVSLKLGWRYSLTSTEFSDFIRSAAQMVPEKLEMQLSSETHIFPQSPSMPDLHSISRLTLLGSESFVRPIISAVSPLLQYLQTNVTSEFVLHLAASFQYLQCFSLTLSRHPTLDMFQGAAHGAALADALMHISQIDIWSPNELLDWNDRTGILDAITRRLKVSSLVTTRPVGITTASVLVPDEDAVRLDCLSLRVPKTHRHDFQKKLEELMDDFGYRRLNEVCENRIFWLHPDFHDSPLMWGTPSKEFYLL